MSNMDIDSFFDTLVNKMGFTFTADAIHPLKLQDGDLFESGVYFENSDIDGLRIIEGDSIILLLYFSREIPGSAESTELYPNYKKFEVVKRINLNNRGSLVIARSKF